MRRGARGLAGVGALCWATTARAQGGAPNGGLAPPPPMQPAPGGYGTAAPPPSQTQQALQTSEDQDSHRGLEWGFLHAEGGVQFLGLQTLKTGDSPVAVGTAHSSGVGPMLGVSAGVRLLILTIGVRARLAFLPDYQYLSIDPEVGLHIPLGALEPYVFLGAGYSALGGFKLDTQSLQVRGFNVRAGFGLDYYVSNYFSVGGLVTSEVVAMTRAGLSAPTSGTGAGAAASLASGSGVGLSFAGSLVLGLHF